MINSDNENNNQIDILKKENELLRAENNTLKQKITHLKKNQTTESTINSLFQHLLENIPDCIYFKNTKSEFIAVSDSMLKLFLINSIDDIIGKTDFDIQDLEHATKAFEDEQNIIKTGEPLINIIEKETHANNAIRWVSTTKLPLKDKNDNIIGIFGISREITAMVNLEKELILKNEELQAAEEELRQNIEELKCTQEDLLYRKTQIELKNNELKLHKEHLESIVKERTKDLLIAKERAEESDNLKSAFLANISHEIRTPMNAIVGFTNLFKTDNLDSEQLSFIKRISEGSKSLMELINNVLDFSLLESNQIKPMHKPFNIGDLINDLYNNIEIDECKKNIQFTLNNQLPNPSLVINNDHYKIKQILTNLISNAIKYTQDGIIEIGITADDKNICCYIKDSGIGIPENELNYIFDRFRKIEIYKHSLYRGAGLGLAIAKKLALLLHGDLTVKSSINQGSCFYLTLPL